MFSSRFPWNNGIAKGKSVCKQCCLGAGCGPSAPSAAVGGGWGGESYIFLQSQVNSMECDASLLTLGQPGRHSQGCGSKLSCVLSLNG